MTRRQAAKATAAGKIRLSVYLSKEDSDEFREFLDEFPMITISGFIEKAIKETMIRVRKEGIKPPRK